MVCQYFFEAQLDRIAAKIIETRRGPTISPEARKRQKKGITKRYCDSKITCFLGVFANIELISYLPSP